MFYVPGSERCAHFSLDCALRLGVSVTFILFASSNIVPLFWALVSYVCNIVYLSRGLRLAQDVVPEAQHRLRFAR